MLDEDSKTAPIQLGCDVVCDKSLLRYEIEYGAKAIVHEELTIFDEAGERKLINRQSAGDIQGDIVPRSEANRLYVKEMQPNVAVLSKLATAWPTARNGVRDSVLCGHPKRDLARKLLDCSHVATDDDR